jgi:beta-lactam-binding protein with PASTA domain
MVGQGQTAEVTLAQVGLNFTVSYLNNQTVPSGSIVSQSPAAGQQVAQHSVVSFVVSRGP